MTFHNLKHIFLMLAIVATFSATKYLPGMLIFSDMWAAVSLALAVYVYAFQKEKLLGFEFYALGMMVYLPIASAVMANLVFGQPLLYGLLSQRQFFIVGYAIYVLNCVKNGTLSIVDLERAFLTLSWVFLFANTAANILIDPTTLAPSAGFLDESDPRLMLDTSFIIYGFIHYGLSGILKGRARHSLYALLFLGCYVVFAGGRFGLISMLLAFVLCCIKWQSFRDGVVLLVKITATAFAAWIGLWALASDKLQELSYKFGEAFFVVTTGQQGFDDSANSRLIQSEIASPFIEDSPLFGNGFLSAQWNDGFKGFFGYFHPSDNGFTGIVFVYGFIGLALVMVQYWYAYDASKQLNDILPVHEDFSRGLQCFLLFTFIYSFTSGRMAFGFEQSIFVIAILYCFNLSRLRDSHTFVESER